MTPTRRQRGRKSAASLATRAAFGITLPRVQPPVDLTGEEKETWCLVVDAMPADWFGQAAVPTLTQLCRHTVQARRVAELIERAAGAETTTLPYYESLLRLQRAESAAIGSLSSKLRINPASLRGDRGHLQHKQPGYVPPWEMFADPDRPVVPWESASQRQQAEDEPKPPRRKRKPA